MYVGLNGLSNEDFLQLTGLPVSPTTPISLAIDEAEIYHAYNRSGSMLIAFPLSYDLNIYSFQQRQQRGSIQHSLAFIPSAALSKLILFQTLAPYPIPARVER